MAKTKTTDHPMMKSEFDLAIKDIQHEMKYMSLEISEKLSNRINDTYWKLIPLVMTMQAVIMSIFKWIG